jgi:hypothetical protein
VAPAEDLSAGQAGALLGNASQNTCFTFANNERAVCAQRLARYRAANHAPSAL